MFTNAVFQGGGVKGIALVGALKRVEESGVRFKAVGGTSAGSIVAALYAAGYSADDMKVLLEETNFNKLLDKSRIPALSFFRHKGLYKGSKFYEWIYKCLDKKGVKTFSDLKEMELRIVASDLTNRELVIFDQRTNPNMKIAEAVRMSIGIPIFFEPYKFGERLMVDGGILSNYPLSIFDNPKETVGFKLISNTVIVPTAPTSWIGYLYSIVNTMMDAHDKEDERQLEHENTIHIDNGGIATTKFDLTDADKKLLFGNGYYAASQFIQNVEVSGTLKDKYISVDSPFSKPLTVHIPIEVQPNEMIRVSISGLIRIYIDGLYMLVKGKRIDQYQPVGGVFKRLPKAIHHLNEIGVVDDNKLPIDDASRDDLRIRVPIETLPKFLEWYRSESGREVSPWREFREELIETNLLPAYDFRDFNYERIKTHVSGIKFSTHFNCNELLIAEIYELNLTSAQVDALRELQKKTNEEYMWCDRALIMTQGFDESKKVDVARISETASWLL